MKFTLSWLKNHIETDASLAEIVDALTRIGLEVEGVEDPAAALKDFVIAAIIEAKPHPNADRLQVCLVEVGSGAPLQVVCGAPNARAGLKVVFAPPGAVIPSNGQTLGKGVIRGVESGGMLCSAAELRLSEESAGILELPQDAPVGHAFAPFAGLADPVIDINLLPNRPDAMGVEGIARDLAAAGLGRFKGRAITRVAGAFPCPVTPRLELSHDDAHLAPAFALRLVRGVKNGPSPSWLQKRLAAIGLRPINALVDITNYLSFDRARPLHVFDAGKVRGDLVVRRSQPRRRYEDLDLSSAEAAEFSSNGHPVQAGKTPGTYSVGFLDPETLKALDGKEYPLDPEMVVIADAAGAQSLAGIMGGSATGCDEATTSVLIESALWDPVNIARTGRRLDINSDARYRFERGVDPAFLLPGLELATALVMDFCGGEPSDIALAGKIPEVDKRIVFFLSEVARLTGLELEPSEMAGILEHLGFELGRSPGNSDRFVVKVPSWRPDIESKADLVEEIIRIAGLDRVPARPFPRVHEGVPAPVLTPLQRRVGTAKRALATAGLVEAVTWSFISNARARAFGGGDPALSLANPISADLSDMRPSLLPGLIAAAQRNADRGHGDVALFEVGQIFLGTGENDQKIAAAIIRQGSAKTSGAGRHWAGGNGAVDAFDAKADLLEVLSALGAPSGGLQIVPGGPAFMHPGRSGTVQFGPRNKIGAFGEIHPRALEAIGAEGPLVGFEIILNDIPVTKSKATKAKPKVELSEFMPLQRDFAFVVDRAVLAGDVVKAALSGDRAVLTGAEVFDVYEGAGIAEGKKSVAISVTLQPRDRTLTDAEIDGVATRIIAAVMQKTGATLRG